MKSDTIDIFVHFGWVVGISPSVRRGYFVYRRGDTTSYLHPWGVSKNSAHWFEKTADAIQAINEYVKQHEARNELECLVPAGYNVQDNLTVNYKDGTNIGQYGEACKEPYRFATTLEAAQAAILHRLQRKVDAFWVLQYREKPSVLLIEKMLAKRGGKWLPEIEETARKLVQECEDGFTVHLDGEPNVFLDGDGEEVHIPHVFKTKEQAIDAVRKWNES